MGQFNLKTQSPFSGDLPSSAFRIPGHKRRGDPVQGKTYYTVFARWPNEVRLFSIEWEFIETELEALSAVKQNENASVVFRNDPDVPRIDVSEDLARAWLSELLVQDFALDPGNLPTFIREQLSEDEISRETAWGHAAE